MPNADMILLFVDSPARSAAFYRDLLGREPVEKSPTFAMFVLDSGLKLGLWSKHTAEPTPTGGGGAAELGFTVEDAAALDAAYADWSAKDLRVAQIPTDMDFGRTFVVLDPDGHRLRVFAPNGR